MEDQAKIEQQEKQVDEIIPIKKKKYFSIEKKVIFFIILLISFSLGVIFAPKLHVDELKQIFIRKDTSLFSPGDDSYLITDNKSSISMKIVFQRDEDFWLLEGDVLKKITNHNPLGVGDDVDFYDIVRHTILKISPDGTKIAYKKSYYVKKGEDNHNFNHADIVVSDIDGENEKVLVDGVNLAVEGLEWSKDSQNIYVVLFADEDDYQTYRQENEMDESEYVELANVRRIDVSTKKEVRKYETFLSYSGCGGGMGSNPSSRLLSIEDSRVIATYVQLSDDGNYLYHVSDCAGHNILLLDLNTGKERIVTEVDKDLVTNPLYGNQDEIYYVEREKLFDYEIDHKLALKFLGGSSTDGSPTLIEILRQVLYKKSLDTDKVEEIAVFGAYFLKPILLQDNKLILVEIENSLNYLEKINQGVNESELKEYYPKARIIELNLSDLSRTVIIENVFSPVFHLN